MSNLNPRSEERIPPLSKTTDDLVQSISTLWLYNRLQFSSGILFLDLRSQRCYDAGHIMEFLSFPPTSTGALDRFDTLRWKYMDVVLCGGAEEWTQDVIEWLANGRKSGRIYRLTSSIDAFNFAYPFLMKTSRDISGIHQPLTYNNRSYQVKYPNEILENFLFLGNQWQACEDTILADLKITHILSFGSTTGQIPETSRALNRLHIPLGDTSTECLHPHYRSIKTFINSAAAEHREHRVLVHCQQGISRSATYVIWYLMDRYQIPLRQAYNVVLERRDIIYPNLGFMKQLVDIEQQLFMCSSVPRSTQAIDALQRGLPLAKPQRRPAPTFVKNKLVKTNVFRFWIKRMMVKTKLRTA